MYEIWDEFIFVQHIITIVKHFNQKQRRLCVRMTKILSEKHTLLHSSWIKYFFFIHECHIRENIINLLEIQSVCIDIDNKKKIS